MENGFNNCLKQAVKALEYLAEHGKCASGGQEFPNAECCQQIADEIRITMCHPSPAPDMAEVERLVNLLIDEAANVGDENPYSDWAVMDARAALLKYITEKTTK